MADIIFPGQAPQDNLGKSRLPNNLDLSIWQGDVQEFVVSLATEDGTPVNLSGCTAQAAIRADLSSPTKYQFACTIQNTNQVKLYMSSAVCASIPAGDYVWNFQVTNGAGDVRTYLAGDVKVYAQVD